MIPKIPIPINLEKIQPLSLNFLNINDVIGKNTMPTIIKVA